MRFLNSTSLKIEEFIEDEHKERKYAILSHTWENEEVYFKDMQGDSTAYRNKQGFQKIQYCCKQAREDGIEWVWVDTCCIDKFSSAELSEAINSMFRWYTNAEVCYAYLIDVPGHVATKAAETGSRAALEESFKASKWFTRGWTLQELLAPRKVVLHAEGWVRIGTRDSWRTQISEVTGISERALGGDVSKLRDFSIAQRMCWASKRKTTRPEDIAYCLIGLFDVNMPLLYGEGSKKAFFRLQEELMRHSDDQSLFAWSVPEEEVKLGIEPLNGLLSTSPRYFDDCAAIRSFRRWDFVVPFSMTNKGLQIELPLHQPAEWKDKDEFKDLAVAILNCCYEGGNEEAVIGILIKSLFPGSAQFQRCGWGLEKVSLRPLLNDRLPETKTLYLRNEIIRPHQSYFRNTTDPFSFTIYASPPSHALKASFGGHHRLLMKRFETFSPPILSDAFWLKPDAWLNWRVVCQFSGTGSDVDRSRDFFVVLGNDDHNDRPWCAVVPDQGQTLHEIWMKTRHGEAEVINHFMPCGKMSVSVMMRENKVFLERLFQVRIKCDHIKDVKKKKPKPKSEDEPGKDEKGSESDLELTQKKSWHRKWSWKE